jgi:hypothetical protein
MDMKLYEIEDRNGQKGKKQVAPDPNNDVLTLGSQFGLSPSQVCELLKILVDEIKKCNNNEDEKVKKIDKFLRSYLGIDAFTSQPNYPLLTQEEQTFIESLLNKGNNTNNENGGIQLLSLKKMALSENLKWIGLIPKHNGNFYVLLCGNDKTDKNLVEFAMYLVYFALKNENVENICIKVGGNG